MTQHPPEPLSADEFKRTAEILRDGHVTDTFRFASIELLEPGKQNGNSSLNTKLWAFTNSS